MKKVFLKVSQNSNESTCTRVFFLIKLQASGLQLYLKKKLWHRFFFCELCETFKNTYFEEHLRTAASHSVKRL